MGLGLAGGREAAVSRRRDPGTGAEVRHEALGPLQRRGRRRGAEGLDAGRGQPVDQAQDQRLLRPDHDEVDRVIPGEGDETVYVVGGDRHALRLPCDPGIAGSAPQLRAQGRGGDRPAEGMLPSAGTHDQDLHGGSPCSDPLRRSCEDGAGLYHGTAMTQDFDLPIAAGMPARSNAPEYTVSEISAALKRTVETAYDHVRVRGEISRPKSPGSGHLYLCLKADRAVIEAVCWRGTVARLSVRPEEGMEVICTGRLKIGSAHV